MWKSGAFVFAGFPSPVERVGNSVFEFSTLYVISTALFISLCSERSDADRALVAAPALPSPALLFVLSQNLKLAHKNLASGSPRNGALTAPRPEDLPFWLRPSCRCALCAWIPHASRGGGRCAP